MGAPVLLIAGEVDANSPPRVVTEFAGLFPIAALVTLSGSGHYARLSVPLARAENRMSVVDAWRLDGGVDIPHLLKPHGGWTYG